MAATSTSNISALIRNDRTQPDSAAVAHIVVGAVFLGVGAIIAAAAFVAMTFPAFLPLGYGLLRAMAMSCLLIGFATVSVVGGSYFVLPRLTGARIWNERLARLGLALTALTTLVGLVVVGGGLGDGGEPFALPWWIDLPMLVALAIPPLIAVQTLRHRTEHRTFVSVPFVVTGLAALPLIYAAGNIPGLAPTAAALGDAFLSAGYVGALLLILVGLIHYAVVKQSSQPLAGRQLAQVSYWSLVFGIGWFGAAQLAGGPFPAWVPTVGAVLGLGLPVGLIAAVASITSTLEGQWKRDEGIDPVSAASLAGGLLAVGVAIVASAGSFRATATLVALTPYWEGVTFGFVIGVIPLLVGAWSFHALPRMTGRALFTPALANRAVRLMVLGSGGMVATLVMAGLVVGYSWAGGAFTGAFTPLGEGWAPASAPAGVLLGLATLAGILASLALLSLASLVARTLTRGPVTTQEILVPVAAGEEGGS